MPHLRRAHIRTSDLKFELSNTSTNFCLGENDRPGMVVAFLGDILQT